MDCLQVYTSLIRAMHSLVKSFLSINGTKIGSFMNRPKNHSLFIDVEDYNIECWIEQNSKSQISNTNIKLSKFIRQYKRLCPYNRNE